MTKELEEKGFSIVPRVTLDENGAIDLESLKSMLDCIKHLLEREIK